MVFDEDASRRISSGVQTDHGRMIMKKLLLSSLVCVILGVAALGVQRGNRGQQPQQPGQPTQAGTPSSTADPYANNAAPGTTQFPLAAAAGKDSNSKNVAPPGATNQGPFDPATWKYGTAFNPPAG